jgi:hypothetical protein
VIAPCITGHLPARPLSLPSIVLSSSAFCLRFRYAPQPRRPEGPGRDSPVSAMLHRYHRRAIKGIFNY